MFNIHVSACECHVPLSVLVSVYNVEVSAYNEKVSAYMHGDNDEVSSYIVI